MSIFDANGRLVPTETDYVYSSVDRRYFSLEQPPLDLKSIYKRYIDAFGEQISLSEPSFVEKVESLRELLSYDPTNKELLNGVYVPFLIPSQFSQMELGMAFSNLVNHVEKSFETEFPQYEFKDFTEKNYLNSVQHVEGSRLESVYSKIDSGDLVGLYFPSVFAGYAIISQRSAMSRLDGKFALSGILEVASAFIGSPSLLMKVGENYPNGLALTGVQSVDSNSENYFWYFESYGFNLNLNYRSMVGPASEYFSGGLTLVP